jgi:Tfp pilus assembly protein FimT
MTVVTLIAHMAAFGIPRIARWLDWIATERAAQELASFYHRGRLAAVFRSTRVRLEFGADTLRAVFEGAEDSTFIVTPGPARHGVALRVSRPVIRIHPNGLGYGAANTKLVLRRGAAAESLTTSRLGRLKRW